MQSELKPAPGSVIDPVCGMQVDPSHARASREHAGDNYFFCCSSCAEKFSANPEKYLKAPTLTSTGLVQLGAASVTERHRHEPAPSRVAESTKYFWPMDPEITSAKPGSCPKCGMALELELLSATKTEYVCPMHPEAVSDKPGVCPICGMALEPRIAVAVAEEDDH